MSSLDYTNSVIAAANAKGVDPNLALAVMQQESSGNPNAISSAGAVGLFQLMPSSFPGQNISDPQTNINLGVGYLATLLSQFNGNVADALAAYNWGPGNMASYINTGSGLTSTDPPSETTNYVASILSTLGISTDSSSLPSVSGDSSSDDSSVSGFDTTTLAIIGGVGLVGLLLMK